MDINEFQKVVGVSLVLVICWYLYIVVVMKEFGIIKLLDQVMFIVQVGYESIGFIQFVESFNYSVVGLVGFVCVGRLMQGQVNFFGCWQGELLLLLERQWVIVNLVYSKCMGNNGLIDGWFYCGCGFIQIIGLNNYCDCGVVLKVDMVKQLELLVQDDYVVWSVVWYFVKYGCLKYIDDLMCVMQIINGGQNGIDDCCVWYFLVKKVLVL